MKEKRAKKDQIRQEKFRKDRYWPQDSENGNLSYTKMVQETQRRRVNSQANSQNRKGDIFVHGTEQFDSEKLPNNKSFNCCVTVGNFCGCCRSCENTPLQEPLGLGVVLYFKQLKNMICLLFLCSVLSIPQMYLFKSGGMVDQ